MSEPRPINLAEAKTVVMLALANLGLREEVIETVADSLVSERWISGRPSICLALNEPSISDGPPLAIYHRWVPGLNEIPRLRRKALHVSHLSEEERQLWIESDDSISNVAIRPIDGREVRCLPGDYIVYDRDGEVSDVIPGDSRFRAHFVPIDDAFLKAVFEFQAKTNAILELP